MGLILLPSGQRPNSEIELRTRANTRIENLQAWHYCETDSKFPRHSSSFSGRFDISAFTSESATSRCYRSRSSSRRKSSSTCSTHATYGRRLGDLQRTGDAISSFVPSSFASTLAVELPGATALCALGGRREVLAFSISCLHPR
jgi:hypothetical protein